eukprot:TRINITY_DN973_c0_g1_i1.p2 TRINITY_DN973_c0_g1~~TRINITY_DN973_c0_g1_i1.p2  ORF type:complete len:150 (-),score=38.13 TRINITY_DN973_c0_g1_i1:78-527(-)
MALDTSDPALVEAFNEVAGDASPTNWCLFGYADPKKLNLLGKGSGGRAELVSHLGPDTIAYGVFKCIAVDDRGTTVSRRPKLCTVLYVGPDVASMARARTTQHKGAAEKLMLGTHVKFDVDDVSQLTEEIVVAKLRASGGAHQPTHYEF